MIRVLSRAASDTPSALGRPSSHEETFRVEDCSEPAVSQTAVVQTGRRAHEIALGDSRSPDDESWAL